MHWAQNQCVLLFTSNFRSLSAGWIYAHVDTGAEAKLAVPWVADEIELLDNGVELGVVIFEVFKFPTVSLLLVPFVVTSPLVLQELNSGQTGSLMRWNSELQHWVLEYLWCKALYREIKSPRTVWKDLEIIKVILLNLT